MYREIALQINNNCNLNCPFCFSDKTDTKISIELAEQVKEFCIDENVDTIKITGGEPFLHENISNILEIFSEFNIFIFSNLTVKDCIKKIENVKLKKGFTVLVNYNLKSFYKNEELENINQNIERIISLKGKIILGRTFYKEPFEIEDIINLCKNYKIDTIRVSQSSPQISQENMWLEDEKTNLFLSEMRKLDEEILIPNNIKIHFDCPIRPCVVNEELFDYFFKKGVLSNKCRPRVFIGSDLKVKHCYANEKVYPNKFLHDFDCYDEIFNYIEQININLTENKNLKCKNCKYYGNIPCGCMSLS